MASPAQTITVRRAGIDLGFQVPSQWKVGMKGSLVEADAPGGLAFLRSQAATAVTTKSLKVGVFPAVLVEMRYRGTWIDEKTGIVGVIYFVKVKGKAYDFDFGTKAASLAAMASTFASSIASAKFLGLGGPSA